MTTTAIILYPELLPLSLCQSMYNPIIPLRLENILDALSVSSEDGGIKINITRSLISDLIKRIYIASVNTIFRGNNHYLKMLSIHYFTMNKTEF